MLIAGVVPKPESEISKTGEAIAKSVITGRPTYVQRDDEKFISTCRTGVPTLSPSQRHEQISTGMRNAPIKNSTRVFFKTRFKRLV